MKRLVSRASPIWLKPLCEYGDPRKETYERDMRRGGHWVARKRSGGGTEENPKFELIQTRQQQKAYVREEGLSDPTEFPEHMQVSGDGKSWQNSQGMPGTWV